MDNEKKQVTYNSSITGETQVTFDIQQYMNNRAMFIGLMCNEDGYEEPFGDVTVNLSVAAPNYCGYLNVNDMPDIEKFITDNDIGEFTGLNFYEYMGKKLHFMFGNRALTYVSTEGEPAIKQLEAEQNEQVKKKGRKAEPETVTADSAVKKQEEFEAMKKKTRNMLLGLVAVIVAAVAGIAAYKAMH